MSSSAAPMLGSGGDHHPDQRPQGHGAERPRFPRATAQHVPAAGCEDDQGRRENSERKPGRPVAALPQPDARQHIGEAGKEIEHEHELEDGTHVCRAKKRPPAAQDRQQTENDGNSGSNSNRIYDRLRMSTGTLRRRPCFKNFAREAQRSSWHRRFARHRRLPKCAIVRRCRLTSS
jgi:hypothetical protein